MQSLILSAVARILFGVMFAVSIWILLRGHNEPGGGFIGGLIGAASFAVLLLASGVEEARRRLYLHPVVVMGTGLVLACASGLPGILTHASYLTHQWATLDIGILELKLGTTLIFDVGVYMVVVGGVLSFMLRLYAEDAR